MSKKDLIISKPEHRISGLSRLDFADTYDVKVEIMTDKDGLPVILDTSSREAIFDKRVLRSRPTELTTIPYPLDIREANLVLDQMRQEQGADIVVSTRYENPCHKVASRTVAAVGYAARIVE